MATKPLTGAQRASKTYQKKIDADLRQIKVWVAGPKADPNGIEAARVRKYAAKQPITKSLQC